MSARRVVVLVLGDLGRSPRMQYHALALAGDGADVDLVGYEGKPPDRALLEHPRIRVHRLRTPWRQRAPRALFAVAAAADVARQTASLARLLLAGLPAPDYLLVQTPPAIPTLPVAQLCARATGARLVVDWHNFGADLLALRLGRRHPLTRAAAAVERRFGRRAHAHLCVSEAMRVALATRFGVEAARVLRDRPARRPGPTPPAERAHLLSRLGLEAPGPVVITSSSFTLDEDFDPLLDAMARLDRASLAALFLLTGEGPRRAYWEQRIAALGLSRVRARTLWVAAEDYPRLLGAADLGLSLHRSASGVDLPMKICDMFGAGLPVCALDYGPAIRELVRPGENGLLFTGAAELAEHIARLLAGGGELELLRRGAARAARQGWEDGWRVEAREVFR